MSEHDIEERNDQEQVDIQGECEPLDFPIGERVVELLRQGDEVASHIDGYRPREEQIRMAGQVAAVFADPAGAKDLVMEAPTGIGKTLAYALPALMSGRRVLISTATRYLQDQLLDKDLATVERVLGRKFDICVLKGRSRYICLHRLKFAHMQMSDEAQTRWDDEEAERVAELSHWSSRSEHGDLDRHDEFDLSPGLHRLVTSTSENCTGQACPKYNSCFFYKARKVARKARVVVCNHALLLSDLALREPGFAQLLPEVNVCIFDEAHKLIGTATDVYSTQVSLTAQREILDKIRGEVAEDEDDDSITMADLALTALRRLDEVVDALREYADGEGGFESANDWGSAMGEGVSVGDVAQGAARDYGLDGALADESVGQGLDALVESLLALRDHFEKIEAGSAADEAADGPPASLAGVGKRIEGLVRTITEIVDGAGQERLEVVSYVRLHKSTVELCMIPFDVSQIYSRQVRGLCRVGIYVSATLSSGGDFSYFTGGLGLDGAETMIYQSDFDYKRQALLWLRPGGAAESEGGSGDFIDGIIPLLRQVNGRSMLLLTSWRGLYQARDRLCNADLGMELYVQGEQPPRRLMELFRNSQPGILLGLATFWEGVDIRGSGLVFVAIDKLPFEFHGTAANVKREHFMKARGQSMFRDYLLPKAVLRLKQGVGRLIRDHGDWGLVAVGDDRLLTRGYGKKFLESLPPFGVTESADDAVAFAIEHCGLPSGQDDDVWDA